MMLTGIAGVAICYLTSYAVAAETNNSENIVNELKASNLTLPQVFGNFHKFVKGNGDEVIGVIKKSKLGDKTPDGVYAKIKYISDLIKRDCNFVHGTSNNSELVARDMDGNKLLDMIKASVDAIEVKLNLVKEIAETVYDKNLLLANWFVDFGIVSNERDIKTSLTADILKKCYDPLIKRDGELSQLKNILDGKPPKDPEEDDESDHEDCNHPDHQVGAAGSVVGQASGNQDSKPLPTTQGGSVTVPQATVVEPVPTPTQEVTQPAITVNSGAQTAPSAPAPAQGKNLTQATEQNAGGSQSGFNALAIGAMSVMLLSVF